MERKKKEPAGSFFYFRSGGFTVPELVAVIIIAGIIAAVAVPRFSATSYGYDELRLYDQTLAALRFAQHTAVATQRTVCATFSGGTPLTQLTLTYDPNYGTAACGPGVMPPGGSAAPYTVTAQGGVNYTSALSFTYDRAGRPSTGQTIILAGGRQIVVEAETGYVR